MSLLFQRSLALASLVAMLGAVSATGATLEKLSIEEMSQKATLIVRGKVSGCSGEAQGSLIYTRCQIQVLESWKGAAPGQISFSVPGGQFQCLVQTFTGTPKIDVGQEYVLFLWTGKSGRTQVIGLSQGVFHFVSDSKATGSGKKLSRGASTELMVDSSGKPVTDTSVETTVGELNARVNRALATAGVAKQ